jgi:hypothetical protein
MLPRPTTSASPQGENPPAQWHQIGEDRPSDHFLPFEPLLWFLLSVLVMLDGVLVFFVSERFLFTGGSSAPFFFFFMVFMVIHERWGHYDDKGNESS